MMQKSLITYLDKVPVPSILIDINFNIIWINHHLTNAYNISSGQFIGKHIDSIMEIKNNASTVQFQNIKNRSDTYHINIIGIRDLGWFRIHRIPMKFKESQELILFMDISEYINDIQERVNSELNYQTIFHNAPYGNVLLRLDGIVLDCNQKTSDIFELPIEEMVGKPYSNLINISTYLYNFYEDLAEQIRNGSEMAPFPTEIDTLKGNHKYLEIFPSLIRKNNQPNAIHLIVHDLTEEKKIEQKLSESITVFAAFMENFSGVAFIKSPEGKYIYLNNTLLNLVNQNPERNFTYEESLGKSDFELFSEEDAKKFRKNDLQVLNTQTATQMIETSNVNGILRYWLVNKFPIAHKGESPWAVAGMGVDITDQKESENLLKIQRDFGISLNEVDDPDELIKLCIDSALKAPEIDLIGVYLLNKKNHIFELKFNVGASTEFVDKVRIDEFRSNNEAIFEEKKPVYRNLKYIEKTANNVIIKEGIQSYCIIPIIVDNKVIGVFNVASRNYESISKQTGNILELISSRLGTTLEKIWAQDKIKLNENRLKALLNLNQITSESEDDIFDFAIEEAVKLTKSTHGYIAYVSPEGKIQHTRIFSIHASMPSIAKTSDETEEFLTHGVWADIIHTQKAIIVNQVGEIKLFPSIDRKIFRYAAIPIFIRDQLFAVTAVWNKEEDYEDTDANQITLLFKAVADIIHKRKNEAQRESYRKELEKTVAQIKLNKMRLEALLDLNQMIESSEDEIYDFALAQGTKLTQSPYGCISFANAIGKMKTMRIWSDQFDKSPKVVPIPENQQDLDKGVWIEVIHNKKPIIINDTEESEIAKRLLPPIPKINRYMLIPVYIRERLFAVVALGNKEDNYTESDVKQIQLLIEGVVNLIQKKQDRNQREFYRKELEKTEKINALGILAGGIAHDFNNILTAVLGNISLAEMSGDVTETQSRLNEAKKAIVRSKELTQQLLAFAKGGTPIKKLSSIEHLLRETTDFALRGSNVKAQYIFPKDLWSVEIDRGQIGRVINNLVLNALQAMPNGGTLQIQTNNKVIREDSKLPLLPGNYIVFKIIDEGIGIPKKYLDQIFDPYFTTKEKGSGLGLATSHAIIARHGGHISVNSTVEVGSTFSVFIPAKSDKLPEEVKMNDTLFYGTGKILLMDDEEIIRKVAKRMMEKLGYSVVTAVDGKETLEIYRNSIESGEEFDLVVLDLTIPGGMGGKETVMELKKLNSSLKAIVSSGYSVDPIMSEFEAHGFQGIIAKPYKIEDFSKVIHSVLNDK